jgi:transcriptional regulator with XRE-family HTH domain
MSESEPVDPEQESLRLARLLGTLLKLDGRSVRSVEQLLGLGSSGLGKVLNGNIRLQVGHILMVTNVLGMSPAQFFHMAYPKKPAPHRMTKELRRAQGLQEADEGEPETPEFEERVKRVVLQIFGKILRDEGFDAALLES